MSEEAPEAGSRWLSREISGGLWVVLACATLEEAQQGCHDCLGSHDREDVGPVVGTNRRASGGLCEHSSMEVTLGRIASPFFDEWVDEAARHVGSAGLPARRRRDRG